MWVKLLDAIRGRIRNVNRSVRPNTYRRCVHELPRIYSRTAPREKKFAILIVSLNPKVIRISNIEDILCSIKRQVAGYFKLAFLIPPFAPAPYEVHLFV